MALNLIFIGNPGNGKSTLLNILSNGNHFEGGPSVGTGLTGEFEPKNYGGIWYMDTPGICDVDDAKRVTACQELSRALKSEETATRVYKVFFVVGEKSARAHLDDQGMFDQVMDAVPELTGGNYGVIVNQVSDFFMKLPETGPPKSQTKQTFNTYLFAKHSQRSTPHVLFVPTIPAMKDVRSAQMDFAKLRDLAPIKEVLKFVDGVPNVHVTKEKVADLDPRKTIEYLADAKKTATVLKENEAKMAEMQKDIEERNTKIAEMQKAQQDGVGTGAKTGAIIGAVFGGPLGAVLGGLIADSSK